MRHTVDFHLVPEHQAQMHARLLNWAAWCADKLGKPASSPMFRLYRSTERGESAAEHIPVDKLDAARIAKAVIALPEEHRSATNWHYVKPVSPTRACREIGVSMEELARLVVDARTMLINRRA